MKEEIKQNRYLNCLNVILTFIQGYIVGFGINISVGLLVVAVLYDLNIETEKIEETISLFLIFILFINFILLLIYTARVIEYICDRIEFYPKTKMVFALGIFICTTSTIGKIKISLLTEINILYLVVYCIVFLIISISNVIIRKKIDKKSLAKKIIEPLEINDRIYAIYDNGHGLEAVKGEIEIFKNTGVQVHSEDKEDNIFIPYEKIHTMNCPDVTKRELEKKFPEQILKVSAIFLNEKSELDVIDGTISEVTDEGITIDDKEFIRYHQIIEINISLITSVLDSASGSSAVKASE